MPSAGTYPKRTALVGHVTVTQCTVADDKTNAVAA